MAYINKINPLEDVRWANFLEEHTQATIFHSPEWLRALQRTYGYSPRALTTCSSGERLTNALVFCRVQSCLTGRRLVSLPFSDHCAPLFQNEAELDSLLSGLKHRLDKGAGEYLEIRSAVGPSGVAEGMSDSATFCMHRLDLRPSLKELFHNLHESCIRRKIAKAQKVGMTYEEGGSEELLVKFYQLMILTRRRQHLLPQPLSWFRNLTECLGDRVKIRLACYQGELAGAIITIRYKSTMVYKYGCSDSRFHRLGPMQLLMWKTIEEAKEASLLELDMGRSDWDNSGLLSYKDRWGCSRSTLTYARYPAPQPGDKSISFQVPKPVFQFAPSALLSLAGGMLYRHIG